MDELAKDIIESIQKEVQLSQTLVSFLEIQKQAIEKHDITGLEDITTKQEPIIHQIQQLHDARWAVLEKNGYQPSFAGLRKCIQSLPSDYQAKLQTQWTSLRDIRSHLERLLYINRNIVQVSHAEVERVLGVLYNTDQDTTYGPDATTRKSSASRPLSQI